MRPDNRVTIAQIMRPRGIRGEVLAHPLTHRPDRFSEVSSVVIQRRGREDLELRLERWRPHGERILLKFAGIDTPEDAKANLAGGYVTVARRDVPPPPKGSYYVFDLIGCTVIDESGRCWGEVTDVLEMPSTDVYQVRSDSGELLIPAVRDFVVDVRLRDRAIVVRHIEALVSAT